MFPEGYNPIAERLGDEYLNDSVPPSHAAAMGLKQRKSPSSRIRKEARFADGGDIIEEAVPTRIVRNRIPSKTLSSSKLSSTSTKARDFMDTIDNEIDLMKDEICRGRPGVKSQHNSLATVGGMSARILEKKRKTGNDDSESLDKESPVNLLLENYSSDLRMKTPHLEHHIQKFVVIRVIQFKHGCHVQFHPIWKHIFIHCC